MPTINRRTFLLATAALAACRGRDDGPDGPETGDGTPRPTGTTTTISTTSTPSTPSTPTGQALVDAYGAVLDEVQAVLRASPDHRVARAEALVAAQDARGIYDLVHDTIGILPGLHKIYDADADPLDPLDLDGAGMRFGPRGTLRGGEGSVRDKVALLADLLRQAGFEADVALVRQEPSDPWAMLQHGRVEPEAGLDVDDATWARWGEVMGADLEATPAPADLDPAEVDDLVDRLLAPLSAEPLLGTTFAPVWFGGVPVVRLLEPGGARILDPFTPSATFDDPGAKGPLAPLAEASTPQLQVRLTATHAARPLEPVVLAEGAFDVADLIGRQLLVATLPVAPVEELASAPPTTRFPIRQPLLAVQAVDDAPESEAVLGSVITLSAERLTIDDAGNVEVEGIPVGAPTGWTADPDDVATLELSVDASDFPTLRLRAHPRDASGAPVVPLDRDAVQVRDEGVGVPSLLLNNGSLRVLVWLDQSFSMPATLTRSDVPEALRSGLDDALPGAFVEVRSHYGDWSDVLTGIAEDGSTWDAVVWVSDLEVGASLSAEDERLLGAGPPVLVLSVRGAHPVVDTVVALSDGELLTAPEAGAPEVLEGILDLLALADPMPLCVLAYATDTGAGSRTVSMTVGSVTATATYEVPEAQSSLQAWQSVELEITLGDRTERRLLGGFPGADPRGFAALSRTDRVAHVRDAQRALETSRWLSVDGGRPSEAIRLEGLVQARRTMLPALAMDGSTSPEEALEIFGQGGGRGPVLDGVLHGDVEVHDPDVVSGTDAVRVVMWESYNDVAASTVVQRLDLLRLHRERAVVRDGSHEDHFLAGMRRSARRVLLEERIGDDDTGARLAGLALRLSNVRDGNHPNATTQAQRDAWAPLYEGPLGYLLVPEDPDVVAAYWVDEQTGEIVGLIDGARGGAYDHYINYAGLVNAIAGLLSFLCGWSAGVGAVGAFMAEVVKWWAAATAAVGGFVFAANDVKGLNRSIRRGVCEAMAGMMTLPLAGALHGLFGALNSNICNLIEELDKAGDGE